MKKIIQLLLAAFFVNVSLAQVTRVVTITNGTASPSAPIASPSVAGVVKIGSGLDIDNNGIVTSLGGDVNVLSTVAQIAALNNPVVKNVTIQDSIAGGSFNIYTGPDAVDNGMIFGDALGRKWKRFVNGGKLYIRWYGLIPETNPTVDKAPIIRTVNAYYKKHVSEFDNVQADACPINTWYLIGSKIDLSGIKFYGAGGQGRKPSTLFQIIAGVQPFDIRGEYADVRDIAVRHYNGNVLDSFNHTFKIRSVVNFENVNIISNSCGNGFDISGCGPALTTAPDSIFGNPDHSIFINCQASACLNGAELKGCDANAILFQNCNFAQNAKWGVFDNGFLGNIYSTTHWASNSQVNNSGCRVGDTTFYPYPDSVYNIVGKYPPTNPTYWYKTNFTGGNQVWNATRKYWGGGALWAGNPNSNHAVISCYTEDFQANSIISPRSVWYEGTAGSPVVGGIWQHTFGGTTFFTGKGIRADAVATDQLTFNFLQNDANAEAALRRNTGANGSTTNYLPKLSGTLKTDDVKNKAGNPTAADIENGKWEIYLNTTTGQIRLWTNSNGGMISVQLQ